MAAAVAGACLATAGLAAAKPEYVIPPEITAANGAPLPSVSRLGEEIVCGSGTWADAGRFSYEWVREGSTVRTGPTYVLSREDEHKELWCVVTASSGTESEVAESVNGVCLGGGCHEQKATPPESLERPRITPSEVPEKPVGKELSCSQGTWGGTTPLSFRYIWLRDKEQIAGATASTYKIVAADETHTLACRVTASNSAGEATAESSNSVLVRGTPPSNTQPPEVLGTARLGEAVTCSEGGWNGSRPMSFAIAWLRDGTEIKGAVGPTYVIVREDEAHKLACRVTADNGSGKATATSAAVLVAAEPLKATGVPVVTGTAREGELLKCSEGTWNQPLSETKYQWLRDHESISFATQNTYKIGEKDLGHLLYCQVKARNSRGEEASATSEGFSVPKGGAVPTNTGLPELEGAAERERTLTCRVGSWTNSPSSYAYQWLRDGAGIPNATGSTYRVAADDQAHALSCRVIAENGEGPSEPATSGEVTVPGEPPSATRQPEVVAASEPPQVGESLTCARGEWRGAPQPSFTYEWLRLPKGEKVGTSAAYTITNADRGYKLTCTVTASNGEGAPVSEQAQNSVEVPGGVPVPPVEGPTISGQVAVGREVSCEPGEWGGAPPPAFSYEWLLNGTPITGATNATLSIGPGYRGATLACRVTGTNGSGSAAKTSKSVHISGVRPEPVESPFVSGSGTVGATLTCERGVWNGKPPPSFAYQWYSDSGPIAGATEPTYVVQPADQGHLLSCNVIATNIEGSAEAESINGVVIPLHVGHSTSEASGAVGLVQVVTVPPGVIVASLRRQLTTALENAHLRAIRKAHGFSFVFRPPADGTLEVTWYEKLKTRGAQGSRKTKLVLLARASSAYASVKQSTVRVNLTSKGRAALKGRKHFSLTVRAVFTVPHKSPVTWTGTILLG